MIISLEHGDDSYEIVTCRHVVVTPGFVDVYYPDGDVQNVSIDLYDRIVIDDTTEED